MPWGLEQERGSIMSGICDSELRRDEKSLTVFLVALNIVLLAAFLMISYARG